MAIEGVLATLDRIGKVVRIPLLIVCPESGTPSVPEWPYRDPVRLLLPSFSTPLGRYTWMTTSVR